MQQRIRVFSGCSAAAGDVVLRNNTVHHAFYQKEEGAAICAFATCAGPPPLRYLFAAPLRPSAVFCPRYQGH